MPLSPLGAGAGGGGTGFALGLAPNLFADKAYDSASTAGRAATPAASLAAAIALRDAQSDGSTAGRVAWLATYDNDPSLNIRLMYMDSGNPVVQYQIRSGGAWATNSAVVAIRGASGAAVEFGGIPAQHLPAISAGGAPVDSNVEVKADGVYYDDRKLAEQADIFSGEYDDLSDKPALFSGQFRDLKGTPALVDRPTVVTIADQAAADAAAGRATPAEVDTAIRRAVSDGAQEGIQVTYDAVNKVFNFKVTTEPPEPGDVHDVYYATIIGSPLGTPKAQQAQHNEGAVQAITAVENVSGVQRRDTLAGSYSFAVPPSAQPSDRLAIVIWAPPAAGEITSMVTNGFNVLNQVKKLTGLSVTLSGDTVAYNAWVGIGSLGQSVFPYVLAIGAS